MSKPIVALVGRSSTGKTEIEKLLCKKGWRKIVSYTTRDKRPNEVDGVDYHFITNDRFFEMENNDEFIEKTEYIVSKKHWFYGFTKESFRQDGDLVAVINIDGLKQILANEEFRDRIIVIHIQSSLENRIKRYLGRESDSNTDFDPELCKRLIQRLLADERDFSEDRLNDLKLNRWYFEIQNNGETKESLNEIVDIIIDIQDMVTKRNSLIERVCRRN